MVAGLGRLHLPAPTCCHPWGAVQCTGWGLRMLLLPPPAWGGPQADQDGEVGLGVSVHHVQVFAGSIVMRPPVAGTCGRTPQGPRSWRQS